MDVAEDFEDLLRSSSMGERGTDAHLLALQVEVMRRVVTEYVNEVESGEKFGALFELVPGLGSNDGMYGGPS